MSEVANPNPLNGNPNPGSGAPAPTLEQMHNMSHRDDGMFTLPPRADEPAETQGAELVASSDAPPAQPAGAAPPSADLSPRQAALQLLASNDPASQKLGKELLDKLMTPEVKETKVEPSLQLPEEPKWEDRKAEIQKDVVNFFREKSKKLAKDENGVIFDDNGNEVYHYDNPSDWQVEVETERRLERERNQHLNKVNEIRERAARDAGIKAAEKQWNEGMDQTVQTTLLSFLHENVASSRAATANGGSGVKRAEYEKHVRLAKALARQVAEEVDFDNPNFSGPDGMNRIMHEVGNRLSGLLGQYIPKDNTAPVSGQQKPLGTPKQPIPTQIGQPSAPAYVPPKPGSGTMPWQNPRMSSRERVEKYGLYDRIRIASGASDGN